MTTYTELRERQTGERIGSVILTTDRQSDHGPHAGVMTICGERAYDVFDVEESPADHGREFTLIKRDADGDAIHVEHVFAGSDGTGRCTCRSFRDDGPCLHVRAIGELIESGRL